MQRLSVPGLFCLVAAVAAGTGCVNLEPSAARDATVRFDVRLGDAGSARHPVVGLMVSIVGLHDAVGRQFAFAPVTQAAPEQIEFRVRFNLPAGSYRLRRVSGVTTGGIVLPRFDAELAIPFETRAGATTRMGDLEIDNLPAGSTCATPRLPTARWRMSSSRPPKPTPCSTAPPFARSGADASFPTNKASSTGAL